MRRVAMMAVVLGGCTSFGSSGDPTTVDGGPVVALPEAGVDASVPDGAAPPGVDAAPSCNRTPFIDGFDRATLAGGGWTATPKAVSGIVLVTSDEVFSGTKSLKVQISTRSTDGSSFFEQNVTQPECPITIAFHLRVTKFPANDQLVHLLAVELTNNSALTLSLRGQTFYFSEQTGAGATTRSAPLPKPDAVWRPVRLTYNPALVPPTVEVVFDGASTSYVTELPLGTMTQVRVGATYAVAGADTDTWIDAFSIE